MYRKLHSNPAPIPTPHGAVVAHRLPLTKSSLRYLLHPTNNSVLSVSAVSHHLIISAADISQSEGHLSMECLRNPFNWLGQRDSLLPDSKP